MATATNKGPRQLPQLISWTFRAHKQNSDSCIPALRAARTAAAIDLVEVTKDGGATWEPTTKKGEVVGAPPDNHAEQFSYLVTMPEGYGRGQRARAAVPCQERDRALPERLAEPVGPHHHHHRPAEPER